MHVDLNRSWRRAHVLILPPIERAIKSQPHGNEPPTEGMRQHPSSRPVSGGRTTRLVWLTCN